MRKWIVGVVLVVVAGAAVFLWSRGGEAAPRAAVFRGEPTSAHYDPIATRALDPRAADRRRDLPRRVGDLGRGHAHGQGDRRRSTDCAEAVWGSAEGAVAGCTQALRARYGTPDGQISGQFLIFNLADSAAADELVAAFGSGGFVRLAPGTPAGFDGARSWAQARALGHYVTLSWVGPAAPEDQVDLTYAQVAVDGLSLAIQRRLLL